MLIIRADDYETLRKDGEQTYPHECCGVLLGLINGDERQVAQIVRCRNIRDDRAEDRYQIDPAELLAAQRVARTQGLEIVGFYHSHPDHPAQWSTTDFAEAHWLGCSYVITSVEHGKATRTHAFVLRGESEEDKRFEAEHLGVVAGPAIPRREEQSPCSI